MVNGEDTYKRGCIKKAKIIVIAESCHNMSSLLRIDLDIRDIGSVHKLARADEKNGGVAQEICLTRGILSRDLLYR